MARWLVIALLSLLSLQQSGASALLQGDSCSQSCDDDGPDGRCPPVCSCCTCCGHVARSVSAVVAELVRPAPVQIWPRPCEVRVPPSADLRDILHVPKAPRV